MSIYELILSIVPNSELSRDAVAVPRARVQPVRYQQPPPPVIPQEMICLSLADKLRRGPAMMRSSVLAAAVLFTFTPAYVIAQDVIQSDQPLTIASATPIADAIAQEAAKIAAD